MVGVCEGREERSVVRWRGRSRGKKVLKPDAKGNTIQFIDEVGRGQAEVGKGR